MKITNNQITKSLFYPVIFIIILWIIRFLQAFTYTDLYFLGIIPRYVPGLIGIFTAPLIHADYNHLLSNTLPLLVSGTGIIYFYKDISRTVFAIIWLFTGFWVWLAARPDHSHIGASGLIYGFVCFLFFSGIFRKDRRLLAISLLITFLYGSMVWGLLPIDQSISWESHLCGSIAGIITAIYLRKEGPQQKIKVWEDETEPTGPEYWMTDEQKAKFRQQQEIHYVYKEKEKE